MDFSIKRLGLIWPKSTDAGLADKIATADIGAPNPRHGARAPKPVTLARQAPKMRMFVIQTYLSLSFDRTQNNQSDARARLTKSGSKWTFNWRVITRKLNDPTSISGWPSGVLGNGSPATAVVSRLTVWLLPRVVLIAGPVAAQNRVG